MVSGAQIRAARALLGISAHRLAELAKVGSATVQRFELAEGVPESRGGTLERIVEALQDQGIEFIGTEDAPGVRLNRTRRRRS